MSVYAWMNDHWLGDEVPSVAGAFLLDGYALDDACEDGTFRAAWGATL